MGKTTFFRIKRPYLPQIPRLFTAGPFFWITFGLTCGAVASFLLLNPLFMGTKALHPNSFKIASSKETVTLTRSYDGWKRIVEQKPEYRDGYVMLAWYAQELGKTDEAAVYLQKIQSLDPSYTIPEVLLMER